jgi:transcriptional regulator with XRE-family HTH domain
MTFREKLAMLTEDRIKSVLCRRAGFPPTAISCYLSKDQIPRGDKAFRLARVLGVSTDWLLDDSKGLPVIRVEYPAHAVSTETAAA